ncbi:MAG: glycosyltransferase family 2 protein [Thermogutta sp.]
MQVPAPDLSVIIPVYGGKHSIRAIVNRVMQLYARDHRLEIILVDDASPDDAWQELVQLHTEFPQYIHIIQLMRNFGQHNALMCGLRHARGRYVITMDDDGQHPPEEISKLLEAIEQRNADVVYGVPDARRHAPWRNLGSWVVVSFYKLVFRTRVTPSAFRVLRREAVDSILPYDLNYTYLDGLLAWNTDRIVSVAVEHRPRAEGRSGYSLGKLVQLALNLFTNFSYLPLQVVSVLGLLVAVFGLGMGGYYVYRYMAGTITVPGYASIIVAVLVLGGLQMLALGIIGEYIGRVHININRKPQYVVRTIIEAKKDSKQQREEARS